MAGEERGKQNLRLIMLKRFIRARKGEMTALNN